ncbi:matrixin family metalloprotease [Natronomonas halophila]|uniref:matrixin family metalloprotease n=1 Tax=Natronomonas halophila TaxID=2747817 RepID=UPI0015B3CCE0|nr:matrixin family metalloprotease [Natronomonas halophila]QLD85695.1 matrixin family metalloprotease [Natronomonas halophila]
MTLRRRELLRGAATGMAGAGLSAGLAGCTDVQEFAEDADPRGHPLAGTTTVVIDDQSESTHDLEAITDTSLSFWTENAGQYAGFEVEFRRVGDGSGDADPDVEIEFLDSREELDGCQEHSTDNILGCAPLIKENNRIDRPVVAEVVATGRPSGEVEITTKHEIGHLLGLGHDAEPAYIMSNRIEDRLPEYEARVDVLDAFRAGWSARNDGTRAYNEGIGYWNDDAYQQAIDPFERSRDLYQSIEGHIATAEEAATAFEEMQRPETVDRERLQRYFDTARTVADLLIEAAENMRAAAEAMADGDRITARDRQQAANDALQELDGIDGPSPADIGRALGLVREEELDEGSDGPSGS